MKKTILICYLAFLSLPTHSQTFEEWWKQKDTQKKYLAEQIAALGAYSAVLKEGYEIASQGLGLVHSIQKGEYGQHQGYFNSFSSVNPQIKNHPSADRVARLYSKTFQLTQQIPGKLFPSPYLKKSEEQVIRHVLLEIQEDSDQILSELETLLSDGSLQMKDTDRSKAITSLNQRMEEVYSFTMGYYQDCQILQSQRLKESQAIKQHQSLFVNNSN